MALINCPECGREISDQSEKCINCGYPLKQESLVSFEEHEEEIEPQKKEIEQKKSSPSGCLIILLVMIGFWVLSLITNPPDTTYGSRESEAWVSAVEVVKSNLKAPSTADFPFSSSSDGVIITELDNGKWRVRGWVDAENGFGAKLRSDFTVDIIFSGSSYTYENLSIN